VKLTDIVKASKIL